MTIVELKSSDAFVCIVEWHV